MADATRIRFSLTGVAEAATLTAESLAAVSKALGKVMADANNKAIMGALKAMTEQKVTCTRCGGTGKRIGHPSINGQMCNDCQGSGFVTEAHHAMQLHKAFPQSSSHEAASNAAAQEVLNKGQLKPGNLTSKAGKFPHLPMPKPDVVEINGTYVTLSSLPAPMREALAKLVMVKNLAPVTKKQAAQSQPKRGRKLRLE